MGGLFSYSSASNSAADTNTDIDKQTTLDSENKTTATTNIDAEVNADTNHDANKEWQVLTDETKTTASLDALFRETENTVPASLTPFVMCVVGQRTSGKTTLTNQLCQYLQPFFGTIEHMDHLTTATHLNQWFIENIDNVSVCTDGPKLLIVDGVQHAHVDIIRRAINARRRNVSCIFTAQHISQLPVILRATADICVLTCPLQCNEERALHFFQMDTIRPCLLEKKEPMYNNSLSYRHLIHDVTEHQFYCYDASKDSNNVLLRILTGPLRRDA